MAKYKVSIENIFPRISEEDLLKQKQCIIGISMSNPVYWRSSLKNILEWASSHFEKTHLVIGDLLYRYDEQIWSGDTENVARINAINLGDSFLQSLLPELENYSEGRFVVARWGDLIEEEEKKSEIAALHNIYRSNGEFHSTIKRDALAYIDSQKMRNKRPVVTDERAVELSASYLIEELAVFNQMIKSGLNVIVYPGIQLSILTEIAEGRFSEISGELQKGIYVQLKVLKT